MRATRTRGFFQPKVGVNYNVTDNINVFANFAHVERFVELSIYYNQGLVNPDAKDEKSNQYRAWRRLDLRRVQGAGERLLDAMGQQVSPHPGHFQGR